MKNGFLKISIFFSVFYVFSLLNAQLDACDIHGKTGFAPKNNLRVSRFDKEANGMTEKTFLSIVNRVFNAYSSIVKSFGGKLEMVNKWDDDTVNAYANRSGNTWQVNMFGGLARHHFTTNDGFLLVVCHELGHHIGGLPQYKGDWASNEGQADYFGTLKCMKRVLENDDNISIVSKMNVDEIVTRKCSSVYKNESEIALCQRMAMAGKSLGLLLGDISKSSAINFTTPDPKVVKRTFDDHPAAQCRLDTYFSASLCDKPFSEDVSNSSPIAGTCIKKDGYVMGPRPVCWYRPTADEV